MHSPVLLITCTNRKDNSYLFRYIEKKNSESKLLKSGILSGNHVRLVATLFLAISAKRLIDKFDLIDKCCNVRVPAIRNFKLMLELLWYCRDRLHSFLHKVLKAHTDGKCLCIFATFQ